jgi:hypothetical protein
VHVQNLDNVIEMLRVPLGPTELQAERLYLTDLTVMSTRIPSLRSHEGCMEGLADYWVDS